MIFRQFIHDDLGCASYFVGDRSAGVAAVVDPRLDIEAYLELARYLGVEITHVFETHNHADHVSGHARLHAATGAAIHVHEDAAVRYEHTPFSDGDEWQLGSLVVRAIHTPGHRPEHTSFSLTDTARGGEPWAVLTGDTLFVGDVARPDLAIEAEDGARLLFDTLHKGLLNLPDATEVWPGHLGGSLCGGPGMDMKVCSTIGYERLHNPMLTEPDKEKFVERSLAGIPARPPNHKAIVEVNRGPLRQEPAAPQAVSPRELAARRAAGALVVDVRGEAEFGEGHVPGAICIPVHKPGFGSRLGWIADADTHVVLVGQDDAEAAHATSLAAAVGAGQIDGHLAGGMGSWRRDGEPVEVMERVPARQMVERLAEDPSIQLLDARDQREWDAVHIEGVAHVPYHSIDGVPEGIDPARPVAVFCGMGPRAAVGASMLQRSGVPTVIQVIDGGIRILLSSVQPTREALPS